MNKNTNLVVPLSIFPIWNKNGKYEYARFRNSVFMILQSLLTVTKTKTFRDVQFRIQVSGLRWKLAKDGDSRFVWITRTNRQSYTTSPQCRCRENVTLHISFLVLCSPVLSTEITFCDKQQLVLRWAVLHIFDGSQRASCQTTFKV